MQLSSVDFAGVCLSTTFDVSELTTSGASLPECQLIVEPGHAEPLEWLHHWLDGSHISLSVGRLGDDFVLRFPDATTFRYEPRTSTLGCPAPLDNERRHQLLDQVLPRVLEHLGNLMVHGSAATVAGRTVLFIGDSGEGKSTLAAHFHRNGASLLSDDGLRLIVGDRQVACLPTYPSLRLWEDSIDAVAPGARSDPVSSGSTKRRLRLAQPAALGGADLTAVVSLARSRSESSPVSLREIGPSEATARLLAQCFRLDPTDRAGTARTFQRCADVVERLPVLELGYATNFARLGEVHDRVSQWLSEPSLRM